MKIQKTVLVVYSGIKGSFEEKILESVLKGIKKRNDKAVVIDLYKDKFSPYFEGASLARYSRGETADKHVPKYIKAVKEANEIIIVHETIAQAPDPMMKGFIDKTFLSGHFWSVKKITYFDALWGETSWIKRSTVFTGTTEGKKYGRAFGNSVRTSMISGTLFGLHMKKRQMYIQFNCGNDVAKDEAFLNKVQKKTSRKV